MAGMDRIPARPSATKALTDFMNEVARVSPEQTYVAMIALADETERVGGDEKSVESIRRSARAVKNMIGMAADTAWRKLSWREKFRNRKREDEWKQEHTDALLAEGRRRVDDILRAR